MEIPSAYSLQQERREKKKEKNDRRHDAAIRLILSVINDNKDDNSWLVSSVNDIPDSAIQTLEIKGYEVKRESPTVITFRIPDPHPHIPSDNEYEVLDFKNAPTNLAVVRSDHWHKERHKDIPQNRFDRAIGIMVGVKHFQDSKGRIVTYPCVEWEDKSSGMIHPLNVEPLRETVKLEKITVDDGQWGTFGPNENDT